MVDNPDYVELGLSCADVCRALDREINGKSPNEPGQSVYSAINRLTRWVEPATPISNRPLTLNAPNRRTVADIQEKLVKWGKRNVVSRRLNVKKDKKAVAAWQLDLKNILQVLNVRSVVVVTTVVANFPLPEGTCDNHRCSRFSRSSRRHEHPHHRFRRPE
jgi:hypothetical protein